MWIERFIERHGNVLNLGKRRFLLLRIENTGVGPALLLAEGANELRAVPLDEHRRGEAWAILRPGPKPKRIGAFRVDADGLHVIEA